MKTRKEVLKNVIDGFLRKEQLFKSEEHYQKPADFIVSYSKWGIESFKYYIN